jgi:hypothetical protein
VPSSSGSVFLDHLTVKLNALQSFNKSGTCPVINFTPQNTGNFNSTTLSTSDCMRLLLLKRHCMTEVVVIQSNASPLIQKIVACGVSYEYFIH